ncbi:GGDEF domain-containing protein [Shewanella sp. TC10]|uniref:tetratricopeptide repeat-containing diguanylate cyclase n=1 Tax=Shewanella sp. TC10 TaxID=1419739 RepID=UPI0018928899|nr:GGDEF domain-containing protein [Shewanella sp. TC10]
MEAQAVWERLSKHGQSRNIQFRANVSLINTLAISKQWSKGLNLVEENLNNLKFIDDDELSQLGISATALFYNKLGQYELGLNYANKLDNLLLEGRNHCIAKHQVVEAKFYLKQLSFNSAELLDAITICKLNNEPIILSSIYTFMANLHLDMGNSQDAINLLLENLTNLENVNYVPILSHFYSLLSQAYFEIEENDKAKLYGQKAISIVDNMSHPVAEMIAYEVLYQIAVFDNNFEEALNYYIKFAEADKAYFDDLKTKYLAFQLAQHKAVEQKVQIELLNKQNKLLQASQRLAESETENNRLFMALLIMVISLLAIAAIRSNRNQKRLKHLAQIDSLTQIYNRGHFNTAAQDAMSACQVNQDNISCILFDLDKFKTINDNYGHACGDWVLKNVARTCKNIGRTNDIFARLGGEEFCIILSQCDAATAIQIAEDYRKAIENIDSSPSGYTFPITASFGVTDSEQSGYSVEALTGHADNAMYLAKSTGRNKVCNYADVQASKESCSVII